MEIIKGIHDLVIVSVFTGIVIIPRVLWTYVAIRQDKEMEQLG
jgi:hypothetical protein